MIFRLAKQQKMRNIQKTVWVVCGNRGGVGKTLAALGLVSALMKVKRRVAVLDGDGRSPDVAQAASRKMPVKIADFRRLRPDRYDDMTVFDYEQMVINLLKVSSDVVINTPDGCDELLMQWFDATLQFTQRDGVEFRVLYVMNHRPNGLDILPEMIRRFPLLFPLRNLHFARADDFEAFNACYENRFRDVFEFPKLRAQEVGKLLDGLYLPLEYIETQASHILSRQRMANWLAEVILIMSDIMQIDSPNAISEPEPAPEDLVSGQFVGG